MRPWPPLSTRLTGICVVIGLLGGVVVAWLSPYDMASVPSAVFPMSLTTVVALRCAKPKASLRCTISTAKISCRTMRATEMPPAFGNVQPTLGQIVPPMTVEDATRSLPSQPSHQYSASGYYVEPTASQPSSMSPSTPQPVPTPGAAIR